MYSYLGTADASGFDFPCGIWRRLANRCIIFDYRNRKTLPTIRTSSS